MIGVVPDGITNDEAEYIYSGYSIWKTAHDPTGRYLPLSINLDNSFSPVYIYIIAPFVGLFDLSPVFGRLPFAIMGTLSILFLYKIAEFISKNRNIALLTALFLAISPWHIHISRGAWDITCAMFFFLVAIYIFLANSEKGSILKSLPFFLLAFYSYHATKIFFIFAIPLLTIYSFPKLKLHRKQILIFVLGCFIILLSYVYVNKTQGITRSSVFVWNSPAEAAKSVNFERAHSEGPFFLRQIYINKLTYYLKVITRNYLEVFSPQFLFLYGEGSMTYSLHEIGQMYLIDALFLIMGLNFLLREKNRRLAFFVIGFLLIAPLPSAFSGKTYVMRSGMMLPFLLLLVAIGMHALLKTFSKKSFKLLYLAVICLYLVSLVNYLYFYYFRYPVRSAEGFFKSSKDLSLYLKEESEKKNIVVANLGKTFIFQYAIFNKVEPKEFQAVWVSQPPYNIKNITFINNCWTAEELVEKLTPEGYPGTALYISSCHYDFPPTKIISDRAEPLRSIFYVYSLK